MPGSKQSSSPPELPALVAPAPWGQAPVLGSRQDRWFVSVSLLLCLPGEHTYLTDVRQGHCIGIQFWKTDLTPVFGSVLILSTKFGHVSVPLLPWSLPTLSLPVPDSSIVPRRIWWLLSDSRAEIRVSLWFGTLRSPARSATRAGLSPHLST